MVAVGVNRVAVVVNCPPDFFADTVGERDVRLALNGVAQGDCLVFVDDKEVFLVDSGFIYSLGGRSVRRTLCQTADRNVSGAGDFALGLDELAVFVVDFKAWIHEISVSGDAVLEVPFFTAACSCDIGGDLKGVIVFVAERDFGAEDIFIPQRYRAGRYRGCGSAVDCRRLC